MQQKLIQQSPGSNQQVSLNASFRYQVCGKSDKYADDSMWLKLTNMIEFGFCTAPTVGQTQLVA